MSTAAYWLLQSAVNPWRAPVGSSRGGGQPNIWHGSVTVGPRKRWRSDGACRHPRAGRTHDSAESPLALTGADHAAVVADHHDSEALRPGRLRRPAAGHEPEEVSPVGADAGSEQLLEAWGAGALEPCEPRLSGKVGDQEARERAVDEHEAVRLIGLGWQPHEEPTVP